MRRVARAQAGFTLLEVIVAIAVLGFVLLSLQQGLRFGLTAWTFQARTIVARDELGAVDRLLRGLVERMEPGEPDEPPRLAGLPGAMQFRTRLPLAADIIGTRSAEAGIGVDPAHRLVLRLVPNPQALRTAGAPGPLEEVLLTGVDHLEIHYWRPSGRDAPGQWVRTWSAPESPGLVRIQIVFPPGDRRHWPAIVAAPMRDRPRA